MVRPAPRSTLFPYTTLFRSSSGFPSASVRRSGRGAARMAWSTASHGFRSAARSEEHTSELQSRPQLVCRLLLEKKNGETGDVEEVLAESLPFPEIARLSSYE